MTYPIIESGDTPERVMQRANRIRLNAELSFGMKTKDPRTFDEIAIVVQKDQIHEFVEWMTSWEGVEEFDTVDSDMMVRQGEVDPHGAWEVQFHFLRPTNCRRWVKGSRRNGVESGWEPCDSGWRIEVMAVMDGESPIHSEALSWSEGRPSFIHASFKCRTEFGYRYFCRTPGRVVAEYVNGYGRFAYVQSDFVPNVLVKPRMNLREVS